MLLTQEEQEVTELENKILAEVEIAAPHPLVLTVKTMTCYNDKTPQSHRKPAKESMGQCMMSAEAKAETL